MSLADLTAQFRAELAVADPDRAAILFRHLALLEAKRAPSKLTREQLAFQAAGDALRFLSLDSPDRARYRTAWLEALLVEPHP